MITLPCVVVGAGAREVLIWLFLLFLINVDIKLADKMLQNRENLLIRLSKTSSVEWNLLSQDELSGVGN